MQIMHDSLPILHIRQSLSILAFDISHLNIVIFGVDRAVGHDVICVLLLLLIFSGATGNKLHQIDKANRYYIYYNRDPWFLFRFQVLTLIAYI